MLLKLFLVRGYLSVLLRLGAKQATKKTGFFALAYIFAFLILRQRE